MKTACQMSKIAFAFGLLVLIPDPDHNIINVDLGGLSKICNADDKLLVVSALGNRKLQPFCDKCALCELGRLDNKRGNLSVRRARFEFDSKDLIKVVAPSKIRRNCDRLSC